MKRLVLCISLLGKLAEHHTLGDDARPPATSTLEAANGVTIVIRAQGPYDADVPLQVVCYFKHKADGDRTIGAAAELDNRLGGVISALRNRGEFEGDDCETLLLLPPRGTIKPKQLLLVGLGDERALSVGTMERVGRAALREAVRLGVRRVAFAPLLRDQGNSTLSAGDVESAVVRGVMLAYDTDRRLQAQQLASDYRLEEWIVEAGPAFFDDTVAAVEKGIDEARRIVERRPTGPHASPKR